MGSLCVISLYEFGRHSVPESINNFLVLALFVTAVFIGYKEIKTVKKRVANANARIDAGEWVE